MAEAPRIVDRLDDDDEQHFAEVRRLLDVCGVDYEVDGTLVRGLDFYTRTVFEFETDALEAHSRTIGAGGRYDGLVEAIGGPAAPGCGWAAGIERILLALDEPAPEVAGRCLRRRPRGASASARSRSCASCAAPGCAPSSTSAGARSRAR